MKKPPEPRKPGRKPISKSGEIMKGRLVRMTDAEWAKVQANGGASWLRKLIDRAKPPKPPE